MRIRSSLKGHYRRSANGWIPKRSFTSGKEIRAAGFHADKWDFYRCTICKQLHIFDKDKRRSK